MYVYIYNPILDSLLPQDESPSGAPKLSSWLTDMRHHFGNVEGVIVGSIRNDGYHVDLDSYEFF